jgi:cell division protein FtsW
VAAVTVLLVMVLFGTSINGAKRWLNLGGLGIQPSEPAKIACVLFTALILERRMHRIDDIRYSLLPVGLVVGVLAVLIYWQPDLGTALSLVLIASVMAFGAGLSWRRMIAGCAIAIPVVAVIIASAGYRMDRVDAYWDPWADPYGAGYQAVQSEVAVGTGGILGRGLNQGRQKMLFLPEPHNDFIYAVIGEELGLVGATGLLLCFCVIAWRGLRIAFRAEDAFGALVALGLTTMICVQAFINISVVLTLLPTKGIPLPLVSAGGSSLLVSLTAMGVLLNISQHEAVEARGRVRSRTVA